MSDLEYDTFNLSHSIWCPVVAEQSREAICDCGAEEAEYNRLAEKRDAARYRYLREGNREDGRPFICFEVNDGRPSVWLDIADNVVDRWMSRDSVNK
jgi:hypothetical protein